MENETKETPNERSAKFFARILENPVQTAVALYKVNTALLQAGFTEERAMELTKYVLATMIGVGGLAE